MALGTTTIENIVAHDAMALEKDLAAIRADASVALPGVPQIVTRLQHCEMCGGTGRLKTTEIRCAVCHGAGTIKTARGHMVFSRSCADCARLPSPYPLASELPVRSVLRCCVEALCVDAR